MVRTARFLVGKGCFYVQSMGGVGEKVFYADIDYQQYLRLLKKYKRRFDASLYGFCLMTRSIHLVVHLRNAVNLSLFMQGINQSYALYFNRRFRRTGKVWAGRFKSNSVNQNEDLIDCIKYLEFLPVKAKLVLSPVHYPWSSCSYRVSGHNGLVDAFPPSDKKLPGGDLSLRKGCYE